MSHVFISYSHQEPDRTYSLQLVAELRRQGFKVWIDDEIPNSSRWTREIQKAIAGCAAFVVLMSPRSQDSEWVENECVEARNLNKPRFPLVLEGGVWFGFHHVQAHFVTDGNLPKQKFFTDLAAAVDSVDPSARRTPAERGLPVLPPDRFEVISKLSSADEPVTKPDHNFLEEPPEPAQKSWRGPAGNLIWIPEWVGKIIPPPFAWVEIPAGQVTLEYREGSYVPQGGLTVDVPRFAISKYPITVAQFRTFADARDGYRDAGWWNFSDSAREWRKNNAKPHDVEKFSRDDHPRINVTWFESVAFCRWLASKTQTRSLMLPSEASWQRAAEGDKHLVYPYGNEFDKSRCNFNTSGTTPVTQYEGAEKGDSPFGVTDLSGNVWEWCATAWESQTDEIETDVHIRVLRGGSWGDFNSDRLRAAARDGNFPRYGDNNRGFRCARSY